MPINDIIQKIKQENEAEIKKIKKEADEEIKKLAKLYREKFDIKKRQLIQQKREEIQQVEQQILFQEKLKNNAVILDKKRKIIDQVYKKAFDDMIKLSDNDYIELVSKLISQLPFLEEGKIISSKNKKNQTEKALQKSKRNFKFSRETVDIKGGFIFTSSKLNINNSFEEWIDGIKENTEAEVAKILFKHD